MKTVCVWCAVNSAETWQPELIDCRLDDGVAYNISMRHIKSSLPSRSRSGLNRDSQLSVCYNKLWCGVWVSIVWLQCSVFTHPAGALLFWASAAAAGTSSTTFTGVPAGVPLLTEELFYTHKHTHIFSSIINSFINWLIIHYTNYCVE